MTQWYKNPGAIGIVPVLNLRPYKVAIHSVTNEWPTLFWISDQPSDQLFQKHSLTNTTSDESTKQEHRLKT